MKNLLFIPFLLLFLKCEQSTSIETSENIFAIYLLKDSTLTARDALSVSIENLILSEKHFISGKDIKSYMWKEHSFYLTEEAEENFENFRRYKGSTRGIPFVILAFNERIYTGTFWWAYSSSMPPKCAVIETISPLPHKINITNGAEDKRSDSRIRNSLKMLNILSE
ncbi:MAG: hypothetical protein WAR79_14855 [Melioribacteraceae bacterium]